MIVVRTILGGAEVQRCWPGEGQLVGMLARMSSPSGTLSRGSKWLQTLGLVWGVVYIKHIVLSWDSSFSFFFC